MKAYKPIWFILLKLFLHQNKCDRRASLNDKELDELEKANSVLLFPRKQDGEYALKAKLLTGAFMEKKVFAICDDMNREAFCSVKHAHKLYRRCRIRLSPHYSIKKALKKYCDVSNAIPVLLMPSYIKKIGKRSVIYGKIRFSYIKFMLQIFNEMEECRGRESSYIFYSNGFCIRMLPDSLRNVTITERERTSLALFMGNTVLARGGRHTFIKGHVLLFSFQSDKIREGIDNVMDIENRFLINVTHPMTSAQKRVTMRKYSAEKKGCTSLSLYN